ncbi:unnamed protein product [Clonostachys rosea]|uniref:Uncharacterized protein n=1 Tax=Bionectria ochroleuca TaxID=29856 RepID=A0ABY6U7T9_BIOOC|nr:unnamed protein product [Clonostachys rosea]
MIIDLFVAAYLTTFPLEHDVKRLEGQPLPADLPQRVTEVECTGFWSKDYSKFSNSRYFVRPSTIYWDFMGYKPHPCRNTLAPGDSRVWATKESPFKGGSWQLRIPAYYLPTSGRRRFDPRLSESRARERYRILLGKLGRDEDGFFQVAPNKIHPEHTHLVTARSKQDPAMRISVTELGNNGESKPGPVDIRHGTTTAQWAEPWVIPTSEYGAWLVLSP